MEAKNITKPDEKATANQPIQQAKSNEQPNALKQNLRTII